MKRLILTTVVMTTILGSCATIKPITLKEPRRTQMFLYLFNTAGISMKSFNCMEQNKAFDTENVSPEFAQYVKKECFDSFYQTIEGKSFIDWIKSLNVKPII